MLYQLGVIHLNILKILYVIMLHDNDKQLVVNLHYKFFDKHIALMLNKTLSIRCNSIKCDVCLDSFQLNIVL